jgi:non-homologous end joining protein Ku
MRTSSTRLTSREQGTEIAKSLVERLTAPFKLVEFHYTYRENVEHLIEKGKNKQPHKALVIDLREPPKKNLKSASPQGTSELPWRAHATLERARHGRVKRHKWIAISAS